MTIDFSKLVRGNVVAKRWARQIMGRRKLGKFLSVLFNPCRATALRVPKAQVEQILAIPADDMSAILSTQDETHAVFCQFDKLASRLARRFACGVGRDNEADISQLESEARVGLLKAIRGYSNPEVKFITYAHKSIQNEISRYLQRSMGVTLTGVNVALLVKYKRKLEELTKASLPHGFEDVCRALELKESQIKRLRSAIHAEVTSENELEQNLAATLLDSRKNSNVDSDLIRKLELVSLSALEKYSWISQNDEIRAMFPDAFPSLKDVAAHFDVTPQAASEALKRARKKLAAGLGTDWKLGG